MTRHQSGSHLIADRYAVRALIGRGGSGAVWRGEDLHLKRPVAIKQIVLSEARSTRSRTRAMREAHAVAKLRTPGVVQVYDVHDDGAQISLIMELIEAPSLTHLVRSSGPLSPERAACIGQSLLRTLMVVHAAGVVHRDIKPSNVLVGDAGVHITDFGIALFGDDPALTAAGSVLGTPAYMAPEQARGERAGPSADMYGLGVTLYFAVEGCAPFSEAGSVETTRAVRDRPHRPGERLGPLAPIVDGLLAKDPAARPDTAAIAAALDAAAGGIDIPSPDVADDGGTRERTDDGDGDHTGPPVALPPVPRELPPPPVDDEGRQVRRVLLWGAALLGCLAIALLLLFLAVRDHPEAPATAAAAVVTRPMMAGPVG